MDNFQKYLIMVGIRSHEFTYTDEQLFANISYFDQCFKDGLSAYKALLLLDTDKIAIIAKQPKN